MRFSETGFYVSLVSDASFILSKMKKVIPFLFCLPVLVVASAADAAVFSQLGIDEKPVRWEKNQIVLQVTRPSKNNLSLGAQRLFKLADEAATIFKDQLGVTLVIQKTDNRAAHPQEDGMNEIALMTYPPCGSAQGPDSSLCNDENRFGHTRIYPAKAAPDKTFREIVEADIELNTGAFSTLTGAELDNVMIAVLRHEMGHLLGLAHNCVASPWHAARYPGPTKPPVCDDHNPAHTNALMFPSFADATAHVIAPDKSEWQFLKMMYPLPETPDSGDNRSWLCIVLVLIGCACVAVFFAFRKYWRRMRGTGC